MSESSVYIVPRENIEAVQGGAGSPLLIKLIPDLQKILSGQTVVYPSVDLPESATEVMLAGMPYYQGDESAGAVLVFTPVSGIKETLDQLYAIIWGVAMGASCVTGLVLFVLARRIAAPLALISADAVRVASGDFSYPLPGAGGRDEISTLSIAFLQMKHELEKTEKLRQDLLAGVAHDLRSPLTSIRGFINAVLDGTVPPKDEKKYLKIAADEATRLAKMSEMTLQAAQLQAGILTPYPQSISVGDVLNGVLDAFAIRLAEAGQEVTLECTSEKVYFDPEHFQQIMVNLTENAIKYAGKGAMLIFKCQRMQDGLAITVADNGPGVSEEFIPQLFAKFSREDTARSHHLPGTGLGLSIVRQLAHLNGGELTYIPVKPHGACFQLFMPDSRG